MNKYFSIKRDCEVVDDGGFFCNACLIGKEISEQSPDQRYCQDCCDFLLHEASLTSGHPKWIPKITTLEPKSSPQKPEQVLGDIKEEKTKMSIVNPEPSSMDKLEARGRQTTYKKRPLPNDKIMQLNKEGIGARAIATRLKADGIDISYKTIQRMLSGQRN